MKPPACQQRVVHWSGALCTKTLLQKTLVAVACAAAGVTQGVGFWEIVWLEQCTALASGSDRVRGRSFCSVHMHVTCTCKRACMYVCPVWCTASKAGFFCIPVSIYYSVRMKTFALWKIHMLFRHVSIPHFHRDCHTSSAGRAASVTYQRQ